jgi:two-component system OmpR family response regulator
MCHQHEIHITRSEYLLLRALVLRRGETTSRRQLMQAVWGTTSVSHGALDTLVNTLREKLNAEQSGLISTVRGIGYSLADDADLRGKPASQHGSLPA